MRRNPRCDHGPGNFRGNREAEKGNMENFMNGRQDFQSEPNSSWKRLKYFVLFDLKTLQIRGVTFLNGHRPPPFSRET